MYQIYLDDGILYYPGDKDYVVYDAVVKLAIGQAGSCEFVLPPTNPLYGSVKNRHSMISVYRNNKLIFNGEVRESNKDRNNCKKVYAVGELAFLADSIQPQNNYGNVTPTSFLNSVLAAHNDQVDTRKQFTRGTVSVPQGYDTFDKVTDFNDTLSAIRTNLVENLGGCLRVRYSGSTRYLDYVPLSSYGSANTQGINFGENLLDYAENMTASDIVTCVIPLGARQDSNDEFEKRLDIKSVNSNKNYLTASNTVLSNFGKVWKVVTFDGIEDAATLKTAGQEWLAENQYETMTLKVTAVDLSLLNSSLDDMNLGDRIPCYAEPYGLDITLPIQEMTLNLMAPQNDTITLCATMKNKKLSISSQVGNTSTDIKQATYKQEQKIRAVIAQEVASIMAQFTGSQGGYKLSEFDSNGLWIRDLYMDAPNKNNATNIMEISMAGIRFSTGGYGAPNSGVWTSAWTIGGQFYANFITAGTMMAERIKAGTLSDVNNNFSFNLETGACSAKRLSIDSNNFDLDSSGNITASNANLTGATITGGTITQISGTERMIIGDAMITGKRGNTDVGYIDLSADTGSNDGTVYDAVIGSNSVLRLEFYRQLDIVDTRTGYTVGYFDGNGWHGPVDEDWLPEPTIIYVQENNDGDD